jgi:hypothetical protein
MSIGEVEKNVFKIESILPENILVKNHESDNPEIKLIIGGAAIVNISSRVRNIQ